MTFGFLRWKIINQCYGDFEYGGVKMKNSEFKLCSVIAIVGVVLLYLAMAQSTETNAAGSGIEIQVALSPIEPPQRSGESQPTRPYQATVHISGSGIDREVTTDERGYCKLELPPGQYTISPKGSGLRPPRAPRPQTISIKSGEFTKVEFTYDSGIR
jgi:hypothetical protein